MGKSKNSSNANSLSFKRKAAQQEIALSAARGDGLSLQQLKSEHDFLRYIKLLKGFAQRYCVMISVSNTPCGPAYTDEVSRLVMNLGLKINLSDKFRCAYVAVIDAGDLIFEEVELDRKKCLHTMVDLNGNHVELFSSGFDALDANQALIKINGTDYSPNTRGLNFVVYDKVTDLVLDAVCFDTYSTLYANRPSEYSDSIKKYLNNHPGVTVIGFSLPKFPTENLTNNEQFIINNDVSLGVVRSNLDKPIFALNKYYDQSTIAEVLAVPKSYQDVHGIRRFEDQYTSV